MEQQNLLPIICVAGSSRSGTTMMGHILNNSSEVLTFKELHFFEQICSEDELENSVSRERVLQMLQRMLGIQAEDYWTYHESKAHLYTEEAEEIMKTLPSPVIAHQVFHAYLTHMTKKNQSTYACDQTPRNIFYIDKILALFPRAKFIMMVRDPRAVLLSQKNKWRRKSLGSDDMPTKEVIRNFLNYHPITIGMLWRGAAKEILRNKTQDRVMVMRFEDFISLPEEWLERTCRFLGVSYDSKFLDIPQEGSSIASDNSGDRGIRRSVADAWKKSKYTKGEIYCMQLVVGKQMEELGYELMKFSAPPISVLPYLLYFPIHVIFILIANLGRAKNLKSAIMKRLKSV